MQSSLQNFFSILRSFFYALPWCARWRCGT